jgi:hypothetical protein
MVGPRGMTCGLWTRVAGMTAIAFALVATSCAGDSSLTTTDRELLLVPSINAGWAGWCVAVVNIPVGGCPPGKSRLPVVSEAWSSGNGPPIETEAYAVTTGGVASVSFDGGSAIATHAESELPNGLRAVAIKIDGRSLLNESRIAPYFVPLNARGQIIRQVGKPTESLGVEVPIRRVRAASFPLRGVCGIQATPLPGLAVGGASVITKIRAYSGFVGQGFISCASSSYNLNGWPLLAGVLLSASHPGASPPALEAMRPLTGHPGIFQAPGPEGADPEGAMLARRVKGAWLVTSRAKLRQRLRLLEHLYARVHL